MRDRFVPVAAALAAAAAMTAPVLGQGSYVDPFTLENRALGNTVVREGDVSLGAVFRTDERYNTDSLFKGPRGWVYWNFLPDPAPYQNPNLYPDKRPTYLFGEMAIPAGATLTVHGRFPYVRFFNFSVYLFERSTFVNAPDGSRDGYDIEPDPGSTNPYRPGADRQARNRNFTLDIVAADEPANASDRKKNTVYIGKEPPTIFAGFRMYVSDRGYDGTGWGPADTPSGGPGLTYEARLADGSRLSQEEVNRRFGRPVGSAPPPISVDEWYKLVDNRNNDPRMTPATAPALPDTPFRLFTGMKDTVEGAFLKPEERAKIPRPTHLGGGANATTAYLYTYTSRKFGPVYVFRAKLPTFPNTWANARVMPEGEVQYWSVATMAAPSSGSLWDGVFDMQVPVDKDGFYTIAVSRPEDRPKNATTENGVAWIDWGPGEGLSDRRNREDWGMLLMRFMVPQQDWAHNPLRSKGPEDLASVMGPYYPKGYYTTKAEFEARGSQGAAAQPGAALTKVSVDGTRDMRFGEILVVKPTGVLVYNTTGLNDCPAAKWDAMDLKQIANQHGAVAVEKNGPHFWMMDSQSFLVGEKASFNGIEARYVATLDPAALAKAGKGSKPYEVFMPKKTQRMVYARGKPVFELVDPDGKAYVLQAHEEQFPIESLPTLGQELKQLPPGWRYRTRTLTADLVLDLGPDQTIYAVGDEFHQYYTRIPDER